MSAPPHDVERPAEVARARLAAAGLFAGFAMLAVVDAGAIALGRPSVSGRVAERLALHAFDAAETLGVGALAAAAVAAFCLLPRVVPARVPGRRFAGLLAYVAASTAIVDLAIGDDLRRQAGFFPNHRFEGAVFVGYLLLVGAGVPTAHLVGALLARSRRLALACVAAALGAMVVEHFLFPDDFFGIHGVIAWCAATFGGASVAPFVERAARSLYRGPRGRAALAAAALAALAGLVVPPSNAVRCGLFRQSCALAPWVLASTVWRPPASHAPPPDPSSPWLEHRAGSPPVPPTSPPLLGPDAVVVLLTIDAARADALLDPANASLFPVLTSLARRGVVFTSASAPASQTALSLGTLFSGRYFSELVWAKYGTGETRFYYPAGDRSPRFPELLSERGVRTAIFKSLVFLGGDFGVARGFREEHVRIQSDYHARAREVIDPLVARLQRPGRGPLFLYAHMMEPHAPYDRGRTDGTPRERYLSEIAVADAQIGRVVDVLDKRLGERWTLIVTADHGEAFGEHGTTEHGKTLYEELVHVPLVVAGPRIAPRTIDQRVGLVDLGPTVLDLFGAPTPATYRGQSLVPLLEGQAVTLTRPLLAEGRLRRALTLPDGLKVIDDPRRKLVEVYDLASDPGETHNLFDLGLDRADAALAALRAFFAVHRPAAPGYRPPYKN
jgi:arylsulfatase A-like enzyme